MGQKLRYNNRYNKEPTGGQEAVMDDRLVQYDDKMRKTMRNLQEEYGAIRAGRANPHV